MFPRPWNSREDGFWGKWWVRGAAGGGQKGRAQGLSMPGAVPLLGTQDRSLLCTVWGGLSSTVSPGRACQAFILLPVWCLG